eukprot:2762877-Rhodomonas_salina.2
MCEVWSVPEREVVVVVGHPLLALEPRLDVSDMEGKLLGDVVGMRHTREDLRDHTQRRRRRRRRRQ